VPRAEVITVKAIDLDNRPLRLKARNFVARVIQHEIDHLDGILFVDRIEDRSTLRRVPDDEPTGEAEPHPAAAGAVA
jgi:peptide deformylase